MSHNLYNNLNSSTERTRHVSVEEQTIRLIRELQSVDEVERLKRMVVDGKPLIIIVNDDSVWSCIFHQREIYSNLLRFEVINNEMMVSCAKQSHVEMRLFFLNNKYKEWLKLKHIKQQTQSKHLNANWSETIVHNQADNSQCDQIKCLDKQTIVEAIVEADEIKAQNALRKLEEQDESWHKAIGYEDFYNGGFIARSFKTLLNRICCVYEMSQLRKEQVEEEYFLFIESRTSMELTFYFAKVLWYVSSIVYLILGLCAIFIPDTTISVVIMMFVWALMCFLMGVMARMKEIAISKIKNRDTLSVYGSLNYANVSLLLSIASLIAPVVYSCLGL